MDFNDLQWISKDIKDLDGTYRGLLFFSLFGQEIGVVE